MTNQKNSKTQSALRLSCVAAAVLVLAGCTMTPHPLTHEDRKAYLEADQVLLENHRIDVYGPITLADAMTRTVLANIDHRVELMEAAFAEGEFEKAKLQMLPSLRALAAVTSRGPQSASRSVNLDTGEVSTGGWTSSEERTHELGDLTLSWNILDFGLSYYQAKQQGDAVLVRREMQRSALQNLLYKIRTAYWKAYFAQEFGPRIDAALDRSRKALRNAQQIERSRLQPMLQSLQYQRSLHSIISQLESTRAEMDLASVELRSLMNIPSGAKFTLVAPSSPELKKLNVKMPELKDMLELALDQRPETRQAMYRSRASVYEVKKAILRTLPGLELRGSLNFDTNTYLRDHNWWNLWAGLTANIVDMITAPERIKIARTNVDLADYRRLGVNMAVIAQVQMAARQLDNAVRSSNQALDLSEIDNRLAKLMGNQGASGATSELEAIRQEVTAVYSRLALFRAYADTQNAYGRMLNSLGVDLSYDIADATDYKTLRGKFERQMRIEELDLNKIIADYKAWEAERAERLKEAIRLGEPVAAPAPNPNQPYVFEDAFERQEGVRPTEIDAKREGDKPVVPADAAKPE